MVWYSVLWCGTVWYGVVWCGTVWYGAMWYCVVLGAPSHLIWSIELLSSVQLVSPPPTVEHQSGHLLY